MTQIKKHREINAAAKLITDWRSMMVVHAIYEHGTIRYKDLSDMLELSPTVLSNKLSRLTEAAIISRHQADGAKEVMYQTLPIAKNMVRAYHLLESINDQIRSS